MAKIDKRFSYLYPTSGAGIWDYTDKTRHVQANVLYMLNRTSVMFKYHGLPDTLPARELERALQAGGFAVIADLEGNGLCAYGPMYCGLGGEPDIYGNPTIATISNPVLNKSYNLRIGEECVLVRNDPAQMGLYPLLLKYCTMLHENEITMVMANVNRRVQAIISACDDATMESAKKFIIDLYAGKLSAIGEAKLFDGLKVSPMASTGNAPMKDLVEYEQYIKASMFNELGLSANYNMKRERFTRDEAITNNEALYPLVDAMLESRRDALEQVNEKYGTDITVELNSAWDYRIFGGMGIHNTEEEVNLADIQSESESEQASTDEPAGQQGTENQPESENQTEPEPSDSETENPEPSEREDEQ